MLPKIFFGLFLVFAIHDNYLSIQENVTNNIKHAKTKLQESHRTLGKDYNPHKNDKHDKTAEKGKMQEDYRMLARSLKDHETDEKNFLDSSRGKK